MANTALRRGTQDEGNTDYFTGCPIGGGFIWFGLPDKIPSNCRICDNSTLAISSFAKLYENLGGAWGQSGGSMNIPDLRGRFPRGVDGDASRDPDKASRTAANTGGNSADAVGSVQDDAMQGHRHQIWGYTRASAVGNAVIVEAPTGGIRSAGTTGYADEMFANASNGTPRTTSESRPKNANVYFVIRVE
jgi:microcystin-dependent protein